MQQISSSHITRPSSSSRTPRLSITGAALGAFLCAAALDVVASVSQLHGWAVHAFRGATLLFFVGILLAMAAAMMGHTESRQLPVLVVTLAAAIGLCLRASSVWSATHPDGMVLVLSIAIANLVALSALFDGSLADDQDIGRKRSRAAAARRREKRLVLPRADELWARWQVDMRHRAN